jgi:chromatin remodeling complex protein RSC6
MSSSKHLQKKGTNVKKAPNALAKSVRPDQALAAVVGPEPLPRTELTKRIWAYIRKHKLQDTRTGAASGPTTNSGRSSMTRTQ